MKYQIILESNELIADDDFTNIVAASIDVLPKNAKLKKFKLVEARSLEGIREEAYACEAMKRVAVMERKDWEKEHSKHLKRGQSYKVREIARHPSEGPIDEISCQCGRSIISFRKQKQKDALD